MVSVYGYITVAELEAYANIDYSAIDASFVDGVIEANISQSERYVNIYTHTSFSTSIPDSVVAVSLELSRKLMHNVMVEKGVLSTITGDPMKKYKIEIDNPMKELLKEYVKTNLNEGGVDIIPLTRNNYSTGY